MSHLLTIHGRVMQDPELRFTPSGKAVVNLRVGDRRKVKGQDGEYENVDTYFNVTLWERTAEWAEKNLTKGDFVFVQATLQPQIRTWEASDGTHKASYETAFVNTIEKSWANSKATEDVVEEEETDSIPF